jgi:hypothetical protein
MQLQLAKSWQLTATHLNVSDTAKLYQASSSGQGQRSADFEKRLRL